MPSATPGPETRDTLPRPLTSFVGRERELAQARELLGRARLLTLTGPGGSGKTRLAIQLAGDVRAEFPDGVWFVPLAPVRDPGLVTSSIAQALGLRDISGRALVERVAAHLASQQALLVLDNFEHLLEAGTAVAQLLREAGGLRLVVTSRAPLRVSGEQECPVPPLTEPEAVRLFSERASAVMPGFILDADGAQAVAAIAARLDRLPLALELAAARTKLFAPAAILARLEDALGFLVGGARDAPHRQQTLRATIAWSHDLLSPSARRLLALWSVFRGGAELSAVEAVWATAAREFDLPVLEAVQELVDLSLLRPTPGSGLSRFMMLETIREFAAARLAELPEASRARAAHAAVYSALALVAEPELAGPREKEWLDRLDLEHHNLRAALDHLLESSPAEALRMAVALFWFWSMRGHFHEGRARLTECLQRAPESTPVRVAALAAAGWLALDVGAYAEAAELNDEAVALAGRLGDAAGEGRALAFLTRARLGQSEPDSAAQLGGQAVSRLRRSRDRAGLAIALLYSGLAADFGGRGVDACTHFEEVLRVTGELGWRSIWARASINLGSARLGLGRLKEGRAALSAGLPVALDLGDRYVVPIALGAFAGLAARTERPRLAARLSGAAQAVAEAGQFAIPAPVQEVHERWLAPARKALGGSAQRYEAEGRGLSATDAVALALENGPDEPSRAGRRFELSRREREVAGLVAGGLTNRQVAERLHLSVRTVDVHVDHILTKLGLHTRTRLAAWAYEEGLIPPKNT